MSEGQGDHEDILKDETEGGVSVITEGQGEASVVVGGGGEEAAIHVASIPCECLFES